MFAVLFIDLFRPEFLLKNPWFIIPLAFQVWMFVDSIRRREYLWSVFIFIFPVLNAILYFFLVYRAQRSSGEGFELPGSATRKRIQELQMAIHNLDKAHHHAELGDIYFNQGKLQEAEKCYRAAVERDPQDLDFLAHLGQCLLHQNRVEEARPLLEQVITRHPKHEYGQTMMAYAEVLMKQGEKGRAIEMWESVLENNSYARARVQLAELYLEQEQKERAGQMLQEFVHDQAHAASFQQRQDKPWLNRAKKLLASMR